MTVGSSNVYTATSSPSGYRLYLEMTGTNASTNSLIHTTNDSFTLTSSGTMSSPVALTNGTWGYAISHSATSVVTPNGFDDTYTTMESDTPTSAKFASIPAGNTPAQRIAETHGLGSTNLTVYYGVRADYTTASGAYTNKVLYTAIADDGSTPAMSVSPNSLSGVAGESVSIVTSLYSTAEIESHAYILTRAQYDSVIAGTLDVSTLTSQEMSCSRNTTVDPLALNCTTVAAADGAGYIYVDLPKYSTYYSAPVAINAPDFFTITTMQQMTPTICNSVATPSTSATTIVNLENLYDYTGTGAEVPEVTLTDTRGTQPYETYKVRKLADGNCWMTENLALQNATITSADSNLPSGTTFNLPASGVNEFCTTYDSTNCDGRANVVDAADAQHPEYGTYYNWYAATAGYGQYSTTTEISYSICPKGWKLPTSGSSGEFQALYDKYNSQALMQGAPGFILSGRRNGENVEGQNEYGLYWSSMAGNNISAYSLYLGNTNVYPANYGRKYFGFNIRCIATSFWNITTMQEMTPEIAASVETPSASATAAVTTKAAYEALSDKTSNVPQRVLYDTRDSNTYTVRKLADGNVWMVENLRLAGPKILTSDTSDVSNDFTLSSATTVWCATASPDCYNQSLTFNSSTRSYGTYYNWYSATAGTGGYYTATVESVPNSICPKNWHLPSVSENGQLLSFYNTDELAINYTYGPQFAMAGHRVGGAMYYVDETAYYWSRTASTYDPNSTGNTTYVATIVAETGLLQYTSPQGKGQGNSVRCLAQ